MFLPLVHRIQDYETGQLILLCEEWGREGSSTVIRSAFKALAPLFLELGWKPIFQPRVLDLDGHQLWIGQELARTIYDAKMTDNCSPQLLYCTFDQISYPGL